jgi:KH/beta-lactamase-domain protein
LSLTQRNQNGGKSQSIVGVILQNVPPEAQVVRVEYEGPRIALYSKNPTFFDHNEYVIPEIVNSLKKRVIIRVDQSVRKPEDEARNFLASCIPRDAGLQNMFFDETTGEAIVDLRHPKLISPEVTKLLDTTGWRLKIRKSSDIPSTTVQNVLYTLKATQDERLQFMRQTGERIFRPRMSDRNEVRFTALGGFKEVGRSSMMIETTDSKILLDGGIHPGSRNPPDCYPRLDWLNASLADIDAIVLSHSHLDHVGFLPLLYKYGYKGPLYCTEPTLHMVDLLLTDALKVSTMEGQSYMWDMKDLRSLISHIIPLPYGMVTDISPDVKLVLYNAGHILGSATVHLHVGEGAHNIVYTGDFKFAKSLLLEAASFNYPRVETLITESTYGNKQDISPPREETEMTFVNSINSTLKEGGKVLIPVPAIGRAQEIMLVLDLYMRHNILSEAPIFVEGMIKEATAIHMYYPEYLSRELRDRIVEQDENPFITEYFTVIDHPSKREEALASGPAVIMATSGMMEGGPSVQYFQELASDPKNKILFVSYQVQGTLGRRVLDSSRQVTLVEDGGRMKIVDVNCKVEKVEGFSGHSDYNQIIRYISKLRPKLQRVIVGHGERKKCENLADSIERIFRLPAYQPNVLDSIKLY